MKSYHNQCIASFPHVPKGHRDCLQYTVSIVIWLCLKRSGALKSQIEVSDTRMKHFYIKMAFFVFVSPSKSPELIY